MNAIEAITTIINKCDLLLDGKVFSKELLLQTFADFLTATTEKETHNVGYVLHTGSVCFDAIALVYAAATCLVYNDTRADDVISSLNEGDIVLYQKSRYIFRGFHSEKEFPGVKYIKLETNASNFNYIPQSQWRHVIPYFGTSKTMDGRGIRTKGNARNIFYSEVLEYSTDNIPSVLNVSAVVVMSQERIKNIIDKLTIRFGNNEAKLTDLVTISYYTENEEYSLGGNVAKTETIIKATNKMSVARDLILSRNGNRHIGVIVFGNEIITRNISELPEIINRRSIQYVFLLMNMDYSNAVSLIRDTDKPNVFLCSKDFLLSNSLPTSNRNFYTDELSRQVDAIIKRDINPRILNGFFTWDGYKEFKKAIIFIKNSDFISDEKEDFLITAYFLMNLFLTAVFTIADLEKCISEKIIDIISVEQRLSSLRELSNKMPQALKDKTETIIPMLETAYLYLTESSEKESYLRRILIEYHDKKIAVIVPKSYYATVMRECGLYELMDNEQLLTVTTANRFDNSFVYDRIIIVGNFAGKRFDVFRCMASERIETLLYEFESNIFKYRMKSAKKTERELNSMNTAASFEYDDDSEDLFYTDGADENEVAKIAYIDSEVDEYLTHLNEIAIFRGLESYGAVQSTNQFSEVIAVGTFDNGEKIFFTKMYKAYVFDDGDGTVKELGVSDLNEGDSLVFARSNSETRDIVDTILGKLIDEQKFSNDIIECYRKSKYWKQALRDYMLKTDMSVKEIASRMIKNGVSVQEITIRGWLDEDSHTVGPRREDSIAQIALLVGNNDMFDNAKEYHDACAVIRRIRRDILTQIGKAMIDKLSGQVPASGTIMADIYDRIGSIAQILRLESITIVERNVPTNMVNRPITDKYVGG